MEYKFNYAKLHERTIGDDIELLSDDLKFNIINSCRSQSKSLIQNNDESLQEIICKRKSFSINGKLKSIKTMFLNRPSFLFLYLAFTASIILDNFENIENTTLQTVVIMLGSVIGPWLSNIQLISIIFLNFGLNLWIFFVWQLESYYIIPFIQYKIRSFMIFLIAIIPFFYLYYLYLKVWFYFDASLYIYLCILLLF